MLAHCTGRNPQTRELSTANAYALLGELNHYADRQHFYPGDPAAGLASFGAEDAPFNHAYLVHLGEELEADGFTAAVDTLANYLYHGTLTTAAAFFDKCRAVQSADDDLRPAPLRRCGPSAFASWDSRRTTCRGAPPTIYAAI